LSHPTPDAVHKSQNPGDAVTDPNIESDPNGKLLTGLGLLAVGFYAVHAAHELWMGRPESLLWSCHLGSLAVGVGLLRRWPTWIGVGLLWLVVGVPLWVMETAMQGGFEPTATLPHLGGLAIGLVGVRKLGLPQPVWRKAMAAILALQLLTRWITPEAANINLAFAVWPGWEQYFPSYGVYITSIDLLGLVLFAGLEYAIRRTILRGRTKEPSRPRPRKSTPSLPPRT
jgi:hypothetical protein